jgi:hypothetical protein
VVFGIRATGLLDQRTENHLLDVWREGRSSLRECVGRPPMKSTTHPRAAIKK